MASPVASVSAHQLVRDHDWSATPLGPRDRWPRTLVGYVDMVLAMPTPAVIFWGPEQTQIYNDGYAVIMGPRHPRYFGASYRSCWPDTFPVIFPHMLDVLERGQTWQVARAEFPMTRHGFPEEAYFTFTFSPLRDDRGEIAGIFQPVVEATDAVLAERRAETLRPLARTSGTIRERIASAAQTLAGNPRDLPFVRVFLQSEARGRLVLALSTGIDEVGDGGSSEAPPIARQVHESGRPATVTAEDAGVHGHRGVTGAPTTAAHVVPVAVPGGEARGVAILGLSPRLVVDDRYRNFLEAIGHDLARGLATEHARIALSESQSRLRQVAEASGVGSWEMDLATGEVRADDRLLALFGLAPGPQAWTAIVGQVHPDDRPQLTEPLRAALAGESGDDYRTEYRTLADDGERWIEGRGHVVRDEAGVPLRVMGFSVDISDRKLAEVERAGLLANAQAARAEAESASRAKDDFLAMLGHELRNPLAPILTALDLMRLHGGEALRRERSVIERQTDHLVRLVDDLLDVSRIRQGKLELKRAPVELWAVVATAIETASPLLEQRAHILIVDVPQEGMEVHADRARLAQAVSNLLTNAAKYTEPGGRIEIAASVDGPEIVLRVRDNGIGIDAEMLPRIFELFAQERQALDRSQGGLGLGLAIVRSIVALHGGSVAAHSDGRGKGSEIALRLPRSRPDDTPLAVPVVAPAPPVARDRRPTQVLIVDDNEDAAALLAAGLSATGYLVEVAHDGPAALAVVERFAPDIAVLDIGLPVMDGYELARSLRERLPGLCLVAVTGYGQKGDRDRSAAAGFDRHLVKPVGLDQVRKTLEELVPR
jgi:PAS domain S-box-containing protein